MALIQCPECGREISNKSSACINCGFPIGIESDAADEVDILLHDINNILNGEESDIRLYKVIFRGFSSSKMYSNYRFKASAVVGSISGQNRSGADSISRNERCIILDGLFESNALKIQSILNKYGCITEVSESNETEVSRANTKVENLDIDDGILKCPRCKSTAITTGQRGYSLISGFIGSNDTINRCGNCGYKWKPSL